MVSPIHDKGELVRQLREAIATTTTFCLEHGITPATIRDARGFEREKLKEDAVAALVVNDETRRQYLNLAAAVDSLFKSQLPDAAAFEFSPICNVFKVDCGENSVGTPGRGHLGGDGRSGSAS